jgi:ADP-ribose pyrophosphatase YjhB (NUDIX family)
MVCFDDGHGSLSLSSGKRLEAISLGPLILSALAEISRTRMAPSPIFHLYFLLRHLYHRFPEAINNPMGLRKGGGMRVRVSAVFERDQEILCMKYVYGGKEVYALPGGGVEKDLPLQEAIVAEWREELGVKLDIGDVLLIGEAPATKRHPQTLHIVFAAAEIRGIPKVRPGSTHSLDIAWVPVEKLPKTPLYPDVGRQLYEKLSGGGGRSLEFIGNCMERGFW